MAIIGRRQPHQPLIVRGGGARPTAQVVVPRGQAAAHAATLLPRLPRAHVYITRGGGRSVIAAPVVVRGQAASLASARRTVSRVIYLSPPAQVIPRLPVAARSIVWGQATSLAAARRPVNRVIVVRLIAPQPIPTTPVAAQFAVRGRLASQVSARRPAGGARIFMAGGRRIAAAPVVVRGQATSQAAARRPVSRVIVLPLIAPQPVPVAPVAARPVIRGQAASLASARRTVSRVLILPLSPLIPQPVVTPFVAALPVVWGRAASQAAALASRRRPGLALVAHPPVGPGKYTFVFVPWDSNASSMTQKHQRLVADILNSLIRQGRLGQTAPGEWGLN